MTVNDTDKFLVNRSGSSYHLEAQNLMAELQDDDLMLVNRSGKSYKATGAEIKESLKPPAEVIKPQIIAPPNGAGTTITPISTEIISVGSFEVIPPSVCEEARQFPRGYRTSGVNRDVTKGDWGFQLAGNRKLGPLKLGDDWGTTSDYGDMFMIRFNSPTLVVGGRNETYSSTVPMTLVGCDDGVNWIFQDHNPGNPVFSDPNTCLRGKQPFKYWGILRSFNNANGPTYVDQEMDGVYSYGALSTTTTELEVRTEEGLSDFVPGSDVEQNDGAASGNFGSYAGNKVYITNSTGTWTPNDGKYIVGPTVTDPNAPDPSGVNFVGSNFVSSDGSLVEGSADWQVTTLADTGYSSIVSSGCPSTLICLQL